MVQVAEEQPIRGISMIFVVLVALAIAVTAMFLLNPGIKDTILLWVNGNQPTDDSVQISENFDKFIENVTSCGNINDEECICEIWPSFPVVFPKDYSLYLNGAENIILNKNNKKVMDDETVSETFGVYAVALNKGELFYGREYYLDRNNILFAKEFPEIQGKSNGEIISKYVLKDSTGDLFIFTYYLGVSSKEKNAEIDAKIQELPICVEGRAEAINEFKRIRDSLSTASGEYTIKLSPGFLILISNQQMSLKYDDKPVNGIKYEASSLGLSTPEGIHLIKTEEMTSVVQLCSGSKKEGSLKNGNIIEIKQESGINCLYF